MDGNTDIHPESGMPTGMIMSAKDWGEAREKARLRETAKVLSLMESDEGALVVTLIKEALTKRIEVLVKQDEQCKAYMVLLSRINVQYAAAQAAVEKLASRFISRDGG